MDSSTDLDLSDSELELLMLNNSIDEQLRLLEEGKAEMDLSMDLKPPDEVPHRNLVKSYNALDEATSIQVLEVVNNKREEHKKDPIWQCSHCNELYHFEDFIKHVCMYNVQHKKTEKESDESESEFKKLHRHVSQVMEENQVNLKSLIEMVTNSESSDVTCFKCFRKFSNETALGRHLDSHIGDFLEPSSPEDKNVLASVTLCIVCGEVFAQESCAWKHLLALHINVVDKVSSIDLPKEFVDDLDILAEIELNIMEKTGEPLSPVNSTPPTSPTSSENPKTDSGTLVSHVDPGSSEGPVNQVPLPSLASPTSFEKPKTDSGKLLSHVDLGSSEGSVNQVPSEELTSSVSAGLRIENSFCVNDFIATTHISKLHQCEFCDSVFSDVWMMLSHVSQHPPTDSFSCTTCELKALTLRDILMHRRFECLVFRDHRNCLKDFPRVWTCNVCFKEFLGLEPLIAHRYAECHFFPRIEPLNNKLRLSCEQCFMCFAKVTELIEHFQEKHLKKPKKTQIEATTSERVTKSASSTRRGGIHQTSTRYREFLCEKCGKSYTQSSHLWQHLRFHMGVKPFSCDVEGCDRKFTIRPDLNDHIRKCHTGERPYLCTICGKRFLTGSVYYQHRLIHKDERRYGCDECDKRFYRADALKNHLPYKCSECDKDFRQRGDRDKHFKARHPDAQPVVSPKKHRIKSFGKGHTKGNANLYNFLPQELP